jgi:hypothetical protein
MLRLQGVVVRTESRPWSKDGRSGSIDTVRVLVEGQDVEDVQLGFDQAPVSQGEVIDWQIAVEVYRNTPQLRCIGEWSALSAASAPKLARAK